MRLTSFTDFGLRALMRLAAEPGRVFTTEEIAGELKISRNHLTKVIQALAKPSSGACDRNRALVFRREGPA